MGDLPRFFTEDLWSATGAESGLYRPLLLLSLALESGVHGNWLAGYHLDNILLHLLVTLAVYRFLRQVQRTVAEPGPSADLYPLLAALVFAVHPVHTEVVNSIFNRSEMLVALAGLVVFGGSCISWKPAPACPGPAWRCVTCLLCFPRRVVSFCRSLPSRWC